MTEETPQQWLDRYAGLCGYVEPRLLGEDRYVAIAPKIFTYAIIIGHVGDENSVDDRWCYTSPVAAHLALAVWDGEGEPQGWSRHPASGRRVSVTGDEIGDDGQRVGAVGVVYVAR